MSTEDEQFADSFSSLHSRARPQLSTDAPLPHATADSQLSELEGLLQGLVTAPPELMDTAAVALVRKATKARSRLSVLLALRALRLEQRLRQAQQQIIQLQWELAQSRRCVTPLPVARPEVED